MSRRRKTVMTKAVRERLQEDTAYEDNMQTYWNQYRKDFLILLVAFPLIMPVPVITNILL